MGNYDTVLMSGVISISSEILLIVKIFTDITDSNIKSRIWDTKNLSTDADSSTDTTVGWTKNTQKPNFF